MPGDPAGDEAERRLAGSTWRRQALAGAAPDTAHGRLQHRPPNCAAGILASQPRHSRASLLNPPGAYLKPFVQCPARPHASRQQCKVISSGSMPSRCTMYLRSRSGGRSGSEWEGRVGVHGLGAELSCPPARGTSHIQCCSSTRLGFEVPTGAASALSLHRQLCHTRPATR